MVNKLIRAMAKKMVQSYLKSWLPTAIQMGYSKEDMLQFIEDFKQIATEELNKQLA